MRERLLNNTMFFKNPLEKKIRQWGKDAHVLPPSALDMKSKVLDLVKVPNKTVSRLQSPRPYFIALSSMAAVLLLFVGVQLYKKMHLFQVSTSGVAYDTAPQALLVGGGGCGGAYCDLSASIESSDPAFMSGKATTLSDSSNSILVNAVDVIEKVSRETSSLVAPTASVPDTREFLQYEYNASIKSRHVQELTGRLQTVVRGYGGRVDSVSVQKKYGYIYFVVPKSSFEEFKSEVKSLANARFYEESVRGQNLLPEKVVIEKSLDTTNQSLVSWQESLLALNKEHDGHILYMQKQLNSTASRIAKLRTEVTSSTARQKEISAELSRLYAVQAETQKNIKGENEYYNSRKFYLEDQIKNTQTQIASLVGQDKELQDTVETVQGSIQVQWVSILETINIYVPYFWLWIISICIVIALVHYYGRRRSVELV